MVHLRPMAHRSSIGHRSPQAGVSLGAAHWKPRCIRECLNNPNPSDGTTVFPRIETAQPPEQRNPPLALIRLLEVDSPSPGKARWTRAAVRSCLPLANVRRLHPASGFSTAGELARRALPRTRHGEATSHQ
jgi:hypothetical protein